MDANHASESILKTSMLYGMPRMVGVFLSLMDAFPQEGLGEVCATRNQMANPFDCKERGEAYMRNIFRDDMDPILAAFDTHWSDLLTLVITYVYGYYQADLSILDLVATSQVTVASLVPVDAPDQVAAHLRGTIHNGGTEEQLKAAYEIAMAICGICEVVLKKKLPDVDATIHKSRLFLE